MNAQQPIARAWSWSVTHSPILNTWRWLKQQFYRQAPAAVIIHSADLPVQIANQIYTITRKTCLWPSERADIARELCAHAQDALAEGRSPEDTLGALGDPRQVAKLLRRSAKRKRHWIWRLRQRTLQTAGMLLLLAAAVYAVLFIRFNTASPTVEQDYLADLNARNNTFSDHQKANTAYRDLYVEWSPLRFELDELGERSPEELWSIDLDELPRSAYDQFPRYAPDAPYHAELNAAIDTLTPLIDRAREASKLPTLGSYYSTRSETITLDPSKVYQQPIPPEPKLEDRQELTAILLPDLSHTRIAATHLAYDAHRSAADNDPERALENLLATLSIARQVSDESFLITSLVAIAIQHVAEDTALRILHTHPDLFNESHLTALAHHIAATAPDTRRLNMDSERMMFEDVLQRVFTDDGSHPTNPDGRLTPRGLALIESLTGFTPWDQDGTTPPAVRLVGPMTATITASRRETRAKAMLAYSSVDSLIAQGPQGYRDFGNSEYRLLLADLESGTARARHPLIAVLLPALGSAAEIVFIAEARTNATLTIIAAHIHKLRSGSWPSDLSTLTPQLLPEIPEDPFDPGAPIKSLIRDGQLILYYNGTDGDDDNATIHPKGNIHYHVGNIATRFDPDARVTPGDDSIPNADWILYPPAD